MTYCPSCGNEIEDSWKFCMHCGKDLQELTNEAPVASDENSKTLTSEDSTRKSASSGSELSNSGDSQTKEKIDEQNQSREPDQGPLSSNPFEMSTQQGEFNVDVNDNTFVNLTSFQRNILVILAGNEDSLKGLDIKDILESYYAEEVNHGRLYPNLDTLAEEGLIEKTELDKRSNGYNLTSYGADVLKSRYNWLLHKTKFINTNAFDLPNPENISNKTIYAGESSDLTGFQIDALMVITGCEQTPKGLDINEGLESYYGEEINHGRLYPNLDTLAEKELIEKTELDKRSNGYKLTPEGAKFVWSRHIWLSNNIGGRTENISTSQLSDNSESDLDDGKSQTENESEQETGRSSELIDDILNDMSTEQDSSEEPDI
jgi:DNA-binding PadR family transcriptional regulator